VARWRNEVELVDRPFVAFVSFVVKTLFATKATKVH
jgi:hypothetical protein